jgi:hypothetical protein
MRDKGPIIWEPATCDLTDLAAVLLNQERMQIGRGIRKSNTNPEAIAA